MSSTNKILVFLITIILFLCTIIITNHLELDTFKGKILVLIFSITSSLILYGFLYVTNIIKEKYKSTNCSKDNTPFYISAPKYCKGGLYLQQGNSPKARFCRQFYTTPAGKNEMSKYTCPYGQNFGYPLNFEDTPMSDNNWKNEMCNENTGVF